MKKLFTFLALVCAVAFSTPALATDVTIDFTAQGYDNAETVDKLTISGVSLSLNKGSNSNGPKYYNTGTAVRLYGGNNMTVSVASDKAITSIVFSFSSGEGNNAILANVGDFSTDTWTGNDSEVTFTIDGTTGHRRIKTMTVTYGDKTAAPVAVESVALTDANGNAMGMYQGLVQGESLQLKAVVAPNNATNKNVTWEVLQETEVISLENGLVKALAPGQAAVVVTTEDGEYQAAVNFVVTEPQPSTIEDFIANKGGTCYLTGIVSNIANDTYGNFDLTDETGTIYVYGCLTPEGEAKKFAELGIEEGNKITVLASTYKLYNDKNKGDIDEAVNVVFVENHGTPAPTTCTFDVVAGAETFTVTPSDNNVQYYIEVLPAGYDIETVTEFFDGMFDEMGAGLEYFSGVQTQSYADDWYMDEPGDYVIYICAVNDNYERASDIKAVEFTLEAPVVPVEVALSNIQIMDEPNPFTGDPAIWWNGQDEEGNDYLILFDGDYNFLMAGITLANGEDYLDMDDSFENNVIVNKTANGVSLDATIKFTDFDEIEQVYHITANIATATMAISDAKYATFVAPFNVEIPEGVKAYTVDAVENNVLTMTEVTTTIPANTPVVLYAEEGAGSLTFTGTAVEGTPKVGLLTGVFEETPARAGSYVLQNLDNVVGFYKVNSEISVPANRAYLTVDSAVKAFYFGEATAIDALQSLMAGKAEIYDMNGRKLQSLQKGMNIVNGKKVMVK